MEPKLHTYEEPCVSDSTTPARLLSALSHDTARGLRRISIRHDRRSATQGPLERTGRPPDVYELLSIRETAR